MQAYYESRDHSYAYHHSSYPEYFAENSTFLSGMVTKLQPFNVGVPQTCMHLKSVIYMSFMRHVL